MSVNENSIFAYSVIENVIVCFYYYYWLNWMYDVIDRTDLWHECIICFCTAYFSRTCDDHMSAKCCSLLLNLLIKSAKNKFDQESWTWFALDEILMCTWSQTLLKSSFFSKLFNIFKIYFQSTNNHLQNKSNISIHKTVFFLYILLSTSFVSSAQFPTISSGFLPHYFNDLLILGWKYY